jgi:hypothetical protein
MPSSLWQILVQNSEIARYNFPAIAFLAMLVVSIILEAAVAVVAVLAARRRNPDIYGLAFTFGAYVLYDLARLLEWNVQGGLLSGLFLLVTITALIAVWGLYRK